MSRKRADLLRLKKRAETYSSAHITHSGSGDLENNGSLSTVNSVSAQSRVALNRLLLGKYPQMSPFPKSELIQSSSAPDASTTESLGDLFPTVKEKKAFKWTPLPPPDISSLLRQVPQVPLTLEQLCAPLSAEEGEEEGGGSCVAHSREERQPEAGTAASEQSVSHQSHIAGGSAAHLKDRGVLKEPPDSALHTMQPKQAPSTKFASITSKTKHLSSFTNTLASNSKTNVTISKFVSKTPKINQIKKLDLKNDIIDLTGNLPTDPDIASSTSHGHDSSRMPSMAKNMQSTPRNEPSEDQEDFMSLCMDVDIETIGDFSDDDENSFPAVNITSAKANPQCVPREDSPSKPSWTIPTSGRSDTKRTSKGKSSRSTKDSSSKNSDTVQYPPQSSTASLPRHPVLSQSTLAVSRTKRNSPPPTIPKFLYPGTSHAGTVEQKSIGKKRVYTADVTITAKAPRMDVGRAAHTGGHNTLYGSRAGDTALAATGLVCVSDVGGEGPSSVQSSLPSHQDTGRRNCKSGSHWRGYGDGDSGEGGDGEGEGGGDEVEGDEVEGGGCERETVVKSPLQTCPMCTSPFPSWYSQVDADSHIAQCLQAIMDFEVANDLTLD